METFIIKALQLILSLSILVIVHEFGHFAFARLFKIRVEKFYMFFNPKFSLMRAKKIGGKWQVKFFAPNVEPKERVKLDTSGNVMKEVNGKTPIMEVIPEEEIPEGDWRLYPETTEWGIGWLPLGGYCKIVGMIDESMDNKAQMNLPPQPWEFRSKPSWQRLLVMVAGVVFNLILAFFIYSMMVFSWGDSYVPMKDVKSGMQYSEVAQKVGFQDGDILLYADGKEIIDRGDIVDNFAAQVIAAKQITVLRDGQEVNLSMPDDFMQQLMREKKGFAGYKNDVPTVVGKIVSGSEAEKAGLQVGDSIVAVNGIDTETFEEFRTEMQKFKGEKITLNVFRAGVPITLSAQLDDNAILGFNIQSYVKTVRYSFFQSFPAGIKYGMRTLRGYIAQFKHVFTKEGAGSLGGFGTLGNLFPSKWSWFVFWRMTAFLSVILAFMNILPIPALDGGHVMFLLYEVVSGRKPSDKFMEYAQIAGMFLLFGLLLYANGMDIIRAIFK